MRTRIGRYMGNGAVALLAWGLLGAWQWHEYVRERHLVRQTVARQADSVMSAVMSGIRSHRWMGPFVRDQLPGMLEELVKSGDILAVALVPIDGEHPAMSAGAVDRLDLAAGPGRFWGDEGFQLVTEFRLDPPAGGSGSRGGSGAGRRSGRGRGLSGSPRVEEEDTLGSVTAFKAILLLDGTAAESQIARAAWNRTALAVCGGLLLMCVLIAWNVRLRFIQAIGKAAILEAEARHLRDLSQAAAGLAHETRNPLSLIRGWTQRLADSPLPVPEQQQVRAVLEECDRVTARINQFLAFARPCQPRLESADADKLVDELKVLLEPDLEAKNLTICHDNVTQGTTLLADREMLRQALFNLVQNAVEFAPAGSIVEIAVCRENGIARLEVLDRGPGVPEDQVQSLFTPYFTTRPGGTGLGLAIVRQIAAAHGWQAAYASRDGGGAVFYLSGIHG